MAGDPGIPTAIIVVFGGLDCVLGVVFVYLMHRRMKIAEGRRMANGTGGAERDRARGPGADCSVTLLGVSRPETGELGERPRTVILPWQ